MRKIIEKRRGLRFPENKPIAIITEENQAYKGIMTDKSKWGAFVSTKKAFTIGQKVIIATLSDDNKIKDKKNAQVKRVTDVGIGVRYEKADLSLTSPPGF